MDNVPRGRGRPQINPQEHNEQHTMAQMMHMMQQKQNISINILNLLVQNVGPTQQEPLAPP